jgi:nitroimidazol reductase NimA-like FMN-containing flavoprotein (pyridoxamine 5'-phosphate oxidase superfamily)
METDSRPTGSLIRELNTAECRKLLGSTAVGRIAVCTPDGPVIIPVNYAMDGDAVVIRTSSYSLLAAHAWDQVAFEIDETDPEMRRGWSVLVVGKGEPIDDVDDLVDSGLVASLRPWAPGPRDMFIKITPSRVTGRDVIGRGHQ